MARKYVSAENIAKLPRTPGVYFLYDLSTLVYIGKATNLQSRVTQHKSTKSFDKVGYTETHWSRARQLEKELLQDYKEQHAALPHYNEQG